MSGWRTAPGCSCFRPRRRRSSRWLRPPSSQGGEGLRQRDSWRGSGAARERRGGRRITASTLQRALTMLPLPSGRRQLPPPRRPSRTSSRHQTDRARVEREARATPGRGPPGPRPPRGWCREDPMRNEDAAVADFTNQDAEGFFVAAPRLVHDRSQHALPLVFGVGETPSRNMSVGVAATVRYRRDDRVSDRQTSPCGSPTALPSPSPTPSAAICPRRT